MTKMETTERQCLLQLVFRGLHTSPVIKCHMRGSTATKPTPSIRVPSLMLAIYNKVSKVSMTASCTAGKDPACTTIANGTNSVSASQEVNGCRSLDSPNQPPKTRVICSETIEADTEVSCDLVRSGKGLAPVIE